MTLWTMPKAWQLISTASCSSCLAFSRSRNASRRNSPTSSNFCLYHISSERKCLARCSTFRRVSETLPIMCTHESHEEYKIPTPRRTPLHVTPPPPLVHATVPHWDPPEKCYTSTERLRPRIRRVRKAGRIPCPTKDGLALRPLLGHPLRQPEGRVEVETRAQTETLQGREVGVPESLPVVQGPEELQVTKTRLWLQTKLQRVGVEKVHVSRRPVRQGKAQVLEASKESGASSWRGEN